MRRRVSMHVTLLSSALVCSAYIPAHGLPASVARGTAARALRDTCSPGMHAWRWRAPVVSGHVRHLVSHTWATAVSHVLRNTAAATVVHAHRSDVCLSEEAPCSSALLFIMFFGLGRSVAVTRVRRSADAAPPPAPHGVPVHAQVLRL